MGASGPWMSENGTVTEGDSPPREGERERSDKVRREGAQPKEEEEEEEQDEGQGDESPFKPFVFPGEFLIKNYHCHVRSPTH